MEVATFSKLEGPQEKRAHEMGRGRIGESSS